MCGRFSLAQPKKIKAKNLKVKQAEVDLLKARYNIAPSQPITAILNEKERHIVPLKWGLVPSWSKEEAIGTRMINARAETLAEKPSFRGLLNKHRCLILADGFYEWLDTGQGKQPYYICLKSREPFVFAGLWSHWSNPKGQEVRTAAIITCPPNALMEKIHNRMPVILDNEAQDVWMDPANQDRAALSSLLVPYQENEMMVYRVAKTVNSPANDSEACLEPAA